MKNITASDIRKMMDEIGLASKIEDNVVSVGFSAQPGAVPFNFVVQFGAQENCVQAWSFVPGLGKELSDDEAYEFCNAWNSDKVNPRAYIDKDRDFMLDMCFWTDEEFSPEYFKENVIGLMNGCSAQFYRELDERING